MYLLSGRHVSVYAVHTVTSLEYQKLKLLIIVNDTALSVKRLWQSMHNISFSVADLHVCLLVPWARFPGCAP